MSDFTQSATQTIIAHQALTHPGMLEGTPVACASYLSGTIVVRVANVETIANATGVWVKELPITPERILKALRAE